MSGLRWGQGRPDEFVRRVKAMLRSQPHYKPALLLAALDLIDEGVASPHHVPLPALVDAFARRLGLAGLDGEDRAFMPAWHLAAASGTAHPFWDLVKRAMPVAGSKPTSTAGLLQRADAVSFLPELADALEAPLPRLIAREAVFDLLRRDRRPAASRLLLAWPQDLAEMTEADRSLEARESAEFQLDDPDAALTTSERTAIRRCSSFGRRVPALDEWRCCLCRVRLRWNNVYEAQAAHIKAHSQRGSDDSRNGLSLCRTHHWAFDAFLWTAEDDLSVRVQIETPSRDDDVGALAGTVQTVGGSLLLPKDERLRPHRLALQWHRERFERARAD